MVVMGGGSKVGLCEKVRGDWFKVWSVGVGSRVGLFERVCGVWFEV